MKKFLSVLLLLSSILSALADPTAAVKVNSATGAVVEPTSNVKFAAGKLWLNGSTLESLYQPLDSDLTSIAALATTSYGRSLLTQSDAPATRTTLGLGTAATVTIGTTSGTIPLIGTGNIIPLSVNTQVFTSANRATTAPAAKGGRGYESDTGVLYDAVGTAAGNWMPRANLTIKYLLAPNGNALSDSAGILYYGSTTAPGPLTSQEGGILYSNGRYLGGPEGLLYVSKTGAVGYGSFDGVNLTAGRNWLMPNESGTVTLNGSTATITNKTISGASNTLTNIPTSAVNNLSGTNTGDQTSVTGNAGTATALQNPRTINGVSFDGTSNITLPSKGIDSVSAKSANFTVTTADKGVIFDVTTSTSTITATLPAAATAGNGWYCYLRKADTASGLVVTSPTTSPSAVSAQVQNALVLLWSDGTSWYNKVHLGNVDASGAVTIAAGGSNKGIKVIATGNDASLSNLFVRNNGDTTYAYVIAAGVDVWDPAAGELKGYFKSFGVSARLNLGSDGIIRWSSTSSALSTVDAAITRISAGLLGIGNGSVGDFSGSLKAKQLITDSTDTATVGDVTINKTAGTIIIGAGTSAATLLNSNIASGKIITLTPLGADATAHRAYASSIGTGTATITTLGTANAVTNATANVKFWWEIKN